MLLAPAWSKAPLFAYLNAMQVERLKNISSSRTLETGQILFMEEDACTGFFVLMEGAMQITRSTSTPGVDSTLAVLTPVMNFAEPAMFGDENYPSTAMALKPSLVQHFPKKPFMAALREDSELALAMIRSQAIWVRHLTTRIRELSGVDTLERVRNWLHQQFHHTNTFELPISKKVLAAHLGMTAETFSRNLRQLQQAGEVAIKGNVFCKMK